MPHGEDSRSLGKYQFQGIYRRFRGMVGSPPESIELLFYSLLLAGFPVIGLPGVFRVKGLATMGA